MVREPKDFGPGFLIFALIVGSILALIFGGRI